LEGGRYGCKRRTGNERRGRKETSRMRSLFSILISRFLSRTSRKRWKTQKKRGVREAGISGRALPAEETFPGNRTLQGSRREDDRDLLKSGDEQKGFENGG